MSAQGAQYFGGDKGIRTPDLYVANVSRYQLCYIPEVVKDGFPRRPSPCQAAALARKQFDDTTFHAEKQAFFGHTKKFSRNDCGIFNFIDFVANLCYNFG